MADREILMQLQDYFEQCKPIFIALGDEVRLTIVNALAKSALMERPQGSAPTRIGMSVKEITTLTHLSRPAISHHLKILKNAGLVDSVEEGTCNLYFLTIQESGRLLNLLSSSLHEIWTCHE